MKKKIRKMSENLINIFFKYGLGLNFDFDYKYLFTVNTTFVRLRCWLRPGYLWRG